MKKVACIKKNARYKNKKYKLEYSDINAGYRNEIKQYQDYCKKSLQAENIESVLKFLYVAIEEKKVKKTTWEKRLIALKKYFLVIFKIDFNDDLELLKKIHDIRDIYNNKENIELVKKKGKKPVNKQELLNKIYKLNTREKAICLVNLITANRPSDMVRIKIKDFHLENRSLKIHMNKQERVYEKKLTQKAVDFVKVYIEEYNLKENDFFVGRIYKNKRYESVQVSEEAYRKLLIRTTGLTAYNLRKTQMLSMYEKGADLSLVTQQTGYKSIKNIPEFYLKSSKNTIDKYL